MATTERITLDPISEATTNAPLEIASGNGINLVSHDWPTPSREFQFASAVDTEGEIPADEPHMKNFEPTMVLRVREDGAAAGTNLLTNPKCAVDTTGWTNASLPIMARVALPSGAIPGVADAGADTALRCTGNAADDAAFPTAAVVNGSTYRFSVYVYIASNSATGIRLIVQSAAFVTIATSSTLATVGAWTRLDVSFAAAASETYNFKIAQNGAGATDFYVTGAMVELSASLNGYFDGDTPGCDWSGANHASTSTRPASGSGARFYQACADLEKKISMLVAEQGTVRRLPPDGYQLTFTVVDAEIEWTTDWRLALRKDVEAKVKLTLRPFGWGAEITQSVRSETTLPHVLFTETGLRGSVAGLGRLTVDDTQAQPRMFVVAAARSRNYSSSAHAALFYEAESRTRLGGSTLTAASGTWTGGTAVINSGLIETYQAVLSSQSSGGTHLAHVGRYRVWARVKASSLIDFALEYSVGDYVSPHRNDKVSTNGPPLVSTTAMQLLDLGFVNIPKARSGAQRWEFRILAKSGNVSTTTTCLIDNVYLLPTDEFYCEARGSGSYFQPSTLLAHDEFIQAAGTLTAKVLPLGGTWVGAGDASDMSVDGAGIVTRTAVSDSSDDNGRFLVAGTATFAATFVQVDWKNAYGLSAGRQGVLARSDGTTSNWLLASRYQNSSVILRKCVAGTKSTLFSGGLGSVTYGNDTYYTIALSVYADGRWAIWVFAAGGTPPTAPYASGYDSALATGGSLATGRVGFYDAYTGDNAPTRTFDNFLSGAPAQDAACFASQSIEFAWDDVRREDASGSVYRRVAVPRGDLLKVPAAGRANRTTEFIVLASRVDPSGYGEVVETADDIQATLSYKPRWLGYADA